MSPTFLTVMNFMLELHLIFFTFIINVFLSDIGILLGGQIHNQLEREVVPALDNALRMTAGAKTNIPTYTQRMNFLK